MDFMNINDILSSFNSNQLQQINSFLNSAQGNSFSDKLSSADKQNLMNRFEQLDPNVVKRKIGELTKEELLRMLK